MGIGLITLVAESSGPDEGTWKVQPRARPWQLPRTRRGRKRPGAISSQAANCSGCWSDEKCGDSGPVRSVSGDVSLIMRNLKSITSAQVRLRHPSPWTAAFRCRRCRHPSVYRSAGHREQTAYRAELCPVRIETWLRHTQSERRRCLL